MKKTLLACVLALATVGSVLALTGPAQATARRDTPPTFDRAWAIDAPLGARGGIEMPFGSCANWNLYPQMSVVIERLGTDIRYTHRWRQDGPNMWLPRVPVGRYLVTTQATCGTSAVATRVESVQVMQKTARTTMSRREFNRIKRGMTVRRVQHILGYAARGRYRPNASYTIDNMGFWCFAIVGFKHGRLSYKWWNVAHD